MLVISMREFRANQSKYLGLVKNGEEVILKSRENGSFALTPVTEFTTLIPKEYILEPDNDLKRAITSVMPTARAALPQGNLQRIIR